MIYLITRTIQHVGRTIRCLCDRLQSHISNINSNKDTNIAKHFRFCHASDTLSLKIQIVEQVDTLPPRGGVCFFLLCKREVYWIFKFETLTLKGLHLEWDMTHVYE